MLPRRSTRGRRRPAWPWRSLPPGSWRTARAPLPPWRGLRSPRRARGRTRRDRPLGRAAPPGAAAASAPRRSTGPPPARRSPGPPRRMPPPAARGGSRRSGALLVDQPQAPAARGAGGVHVAGKDLPAGPGNRIDVDQRVRMLLQVRLADVELADLDVHVPGQDALVGDRDVGLAAGQDVRGAERPDHAGEPADQLGARALVGEVGAFEAVLPVR